MPQRRFSIKGCATVNLRVKDSNSIRQIRVVTTLRQFSNLLPSGLSGHRLQSSTPTVGFGNEVTERCLLKLFLLILESLGSTELVFILIMALVFFGPRKLPQISRSLGKNLAEFRRASEDFKRTWDREVSLEEVINPSTAADQNSHSNLETAGQAFPSPTIAAIAPDQVIPRHTTGSEPHSAFENADTNQTNFENQMDEPKHSPKNDWL
jgi:TatA/E family protein of Tat protein translocase